MFANDVIISIHLKCICHDYGGEKTQKYPITRILTVLLFGKFPPQWKLGNIYCKNAVWSHNLVVKGTKYKKQEET